jgi:hypothetical protein
MRAAFVNAKPRPIVQRMQEPTAIFLCQSLFVPMEAVASQIPLPGASAMHQFLASELDGTEHTTSFITNNTTSNHPTCRNNGTCRVGVKHMGFLSDFTETAPSSLNETYTETYQHCVCIDGYAGLCVCSLYGYVS